VEYGWMRPDERPDEEPDKGPDEDPDKGLEKSFDNGLMFAESSCRAAVDGT
jgi:hypothetical protein